MPGETDLEALLRGLRPRAQPGRYAFVTLPAGAHQPAGLDPLMTFREAEGLTLIVAAEAAARAGLPPEGEWAWITLEVHSSLSAVGMMAAVAAALAAEGLPCNPVAGYHHDHLFVPAEAAGQALGALRRLSAG